MINTIDFDTYYYNVYKKIKIKYEKLRFQEMMIFKLDDLC